MIKRIAVVGDVSAVESALSKTTANEPIEAIVCMPGGTLPPGAAALIADQTQLDAAVSLALTQACRNETLLGLVAMALDAREDMLPGSTQRLVEHAGRFAEALCLDPADRLALERGAYLHDLGKTRISNDVLLKKSVLTYDEWVLLQGHSALGAEIIRELEGFEDVEPIIHRHHCCYDGTGYPDGLEKDEIPLLARAMKILDVYCAMTSPRHYREGHSTHEEAVAHIESERGKHFDPDLARVFIDADVGRAWEAS